ncbi:hypothetical protein PFISCL1PPCAC_19071, partial [Pristionchus fissidentatus]
SFYFQASSGLTLVSRLQYPSPHHLNQSIIMAQYALRAAQRLPRALRCEWEDGFSAQFSFVWLRDNSDKRPSLLHLDMNAKPEDLCLDASKVQLVWPPFLSSEYSSRFLRDHTRVKPTQAVECPITQKVLTVPWRVLPFYPRNEVFSKGATASLRWGAGASEAGTVWPQHERIPSLVTVEALTPGSKVTLIDGVAALTLMAATHPQQFEFLASAPIDYSEDMFHASHPVVTINDGKIIAATFNNEVRSAEITVDCLDRYYQSLKTFHKICLDIQHTILLEPGSVLVVDNHQTFVGAPAQCNRELAISIFN